MEGMLSREMANGREGIGMFDGKDPREGLGACHSVLIVQACIIVN